MTNPPFRTEVQRLRQWCGDPIEMGQLRSTGQRGAPDATSHDAVQVGAVVAHLEPIRSRSSLLSSYAREASPSEPVWTAYAIRWIEFGSGIAAAGVFRSRRRCVIRPSLRGRSQGQS